MNKKINMVTLTEAEYDKLTDERDDLQKELTDERERRKVAEELLWSAYNAFENHWIARDINDHFARYKD